MGNITQNERIDLYIAEYIRQAKRDGIEYNEELIREQFLLQEPDIKTVKVDGEYKTTITYRINPN